ncbi:hypothetical protein AAMO2058_001229200, partial [Amorphochlora amoebiformis]
FWRIPVKAELLDTKPDSKSIPPWDIWNVKSTHTSRFTSFRLSQTTSGYVSLLIRFLDGSCEVFYYKKGDLTESEGNKSDSNVTLERCAIKTENQSGTQPFGIGNQGCFAEWLPKSQNILISDSSGISIHRLRKQGSSIILKREFGEFIRGIVHNAKLGLVFVYDRNQKMHLLNVPNTIDDP